MISYNNFKKILLLEDDEDIINSISNFDLEDTVDTNDSPTLNRPRITADKDGPNKLNKIVRPQGIIVQDTWNNFVFPIQPHPRIDTARFDLFEVIKRFRELYLSFPSMFLPWHYMVEMIGDRYYIFQTRPLDTKFPLSNEEVLSSQHDFRDDITKKFFDNKIYQVNNMIHICLVGDSHLDIYPQKLYKQIGRTCINPMYRDMRIVGSVDTSVIGFNLGDKFNLESMKHFSRK
jgi:hypothetical protein